ncbi:hypothetical protein GCM10023321_18180 [Pseudonocardia eucalypti]|uniref:Uncharacterized protein n=1 Tax=Pseudonocardia eucalypti TaxID=648755 RepID=A0ABP9PS79_9PSEU|nr:hypothetical protein [Pseudonocardia eucalypti]
MGSVPAYVWLTVLVPIAMLLATVALQRFEDVVCVKPTDHPDHPPLRPVPRSVPAPPDVPS